MNKTCVEQLVNAVLYEGHILYPYRPTSKKNQRHRFTFGRVYPEAYSAAQNGAEPYLIQTECLVSTLTARPVLQVSVRFLHPILREVGALEQPVSKWESPEPSFVVVPELRAGTSLFQTWHEAVERRIDAPKLELNPSKGDHHPFPFNFASTRSLEPIRDRSQIIGVVVRRQAEITGAIEVSLLPLGPALFKVSIQVQNRTPLADSAATDSDAVLLQTLTSTHTILQVEGAEFVSLLDPPPEYAQAAETCRNLGTWPVLVGIEQQHQRDTMVSSPIILYDYPKIAPESAASFFDATEIDEMLTLRIQTMTDEEKFEMRNAGADARRLLEHTENLPRTDLLRLHGAIRKPSASLPIEFDAFFGANVPLGSVTVSGIHLKPGDRVRIRPKVRADAMDIALSGQTAIIEAIEQDLEWRIHLAVVLENDPGKDLGLMRQPGHRFFFGVEEVEPLLSEAGSPETQNVQKAELHH